jgi:hypothetical protein
VGACILAAALVLRRSSRRIGLRVPRQRKRATLHTANKCVRPWSWGSRAADQPVVRPDSRVPHLLRPLDKRNHHVSSWSLAQHLPWALDHLDPIQEEIARRSRRKLLHMKQKLQTFLSMHIHNRVLAELRVTQFSHKQTRESSKSFFWSIKLLKSCLYDRLFFCRFFVDDTPIRVFRNNEILGVPFPNAQPMGVYASLWDGSSWATQGGKYPINWNAAPFVASFQGFGIDGCRVVDNNIGACAAGPVYAWWNAPRYQYMTQQQIAALKYVQRTHLFYDYCTDRNRYRIAPRECRRNWYGTV